MADLPILGAPRQERRDALQNRERLLAAAAELLERCGVDNLTMDALAAQAGVGKGTVFRRFHNREGLMAALVDRSERAWQEAVIFGPPPLGPGAAPMDRLLAFGHSRLELNLQHADLLLAAGREGQRSYAAASFAGMHVRYLLGELGLAGDISVLATALLAPLEPVIVVQQTQHEGMSPARLRDGWDDLVRRVVAASPGTGVRDPAR